MPTFARATRVLTFIPFGGDDPTSIGLDGELRSRGGAGGVHLDGQILDRCAVARHLGAADVRVGGERHVREVQRPFGVKRGTAAGGAARDPPLRGQVDGRRALDREPKQLGFF